MINSEKLSLFRTGEDNSTGLTDVKFSPDPIMLTSKLSLNKETISNLENPQDDLPMEIHTWWLGLGPCKYHRPRIHVHRRHTAGGNVCTGGNC